MGLSTNAGRDRMTPHETSVIQSRLETVTMAVDQIGETSKMIGPGKCHDAETQS